MDRKSIESMFSELTTLLLQKNEDYGRASFDLGLNGNHVIVCPCGHEHCRVVKNGRITSTRWDSRNSQVSWVTATTITATSVAWNISTSVSGSSSTTNYCYATA